MIVLISVIGGRIVPAFTRNWLNARGIKPCHRPLAWSDRIALGVLHAGMIGWAFLPDWQPVGVLLLVAAVLNLARLARWRGIATLAEPLLLVLHVGYLWLVVGVALLGLSLLTDAVPAAAAVHALTAGAMGTMILAVMTRATLGHTGRVLHADAVTMLDLRPGEHIGGVAHRCRVVGRGADGPVRILRAGLGRCVRPVPWRSTGRCWWRRAR